MSAAAYDLLIGMCRVVEVGGYLLGAVGLVIAGLAASRGGQR